MELYDGIIKKFQLFAANDGLFTQIIDEFPYPIAVFTKQGELVKANHALYERIGIEENELQNMNFNIFHHGDIHNIAVMEAARHIFTGKTTYLDNLSNPLSLFLPQERHKETFSDEFHSAVFFPILEKGRTIRYGVAVYFNGIT